ncbi:MAG: hypothetical protein HC765_15445 [Brachymonas sp.]|nr:hypothetical protein [Brachymonas sp.]
MKTKAHLEEYAESDSLIQAVQQKESFGLQLRKFKRKGVALALGMTFLLGAAQQAVAACNLSNFNVGLQSTGTAPFSGAPGVRGGDDNSVSDNIVRTNDTYVYRFNYKIPAGQLEDNITFTSQLPLIGGKKSRDMGWATAAVYWSWQRRVTRWH